MSLPSDAVVRVVAIGLLAALACGSSKQTSLVDDTADASDAATGDEVCLSVGPIAADAGPDALSLVCPGSQQSGRAGRASRRAGMQLLLPGHRP